MATQILPRPTRRTRRTEQPVKVFAGTAGHEDAIATFIERVELMARQEARARGKRYSPRFFKTMLDTVTQNLVSDDLPF